MPSTICCVTALLLCGARLAAAQGSPPAIAELQERARADSNDPVAHYDLAEKYIRAGRYEDAREALRLSVRIDPQFAPACVALGLLSPGLRREGRREDLLDRAFLLDPLQEIVPPSVQQLPVAWRGTLTLGLRRYHDQRYREAADAFASVIERSGRGKPEDVPAVALWYHALSAIRLERYDDAIRDLTLLAERSEDSTSSRHAAPLIAEARRVGRARARYALAYLYQRSGRPDVAIPLYQELLVEDLGLAIAHLQLARIYEAQQRWNDAIAERRRAVDANPDDPSLLFDLGLTLTNGGRPADAEEPLQRAIAANPRDSRAYYVLGIVEARLRKVGEARAAFTRFLELAPRRYAHMIQDAEQQLAQLP